MEGNLIWDLNQDWNVMEISKITVLLVKKVKSICKSGVTKPDLLWIYSRSPFFTNAQDNNYWYL
jgi:hypothetical protein